MNFQLRTAGGYPMGEVSSALQKEIRRGNEVEAVFWVQELESRFYKYVWRRLLVIAHEDVGMADPEAIEFVETCRKHYFVMIEDGNWENLPLINAVVALCRAKKTRLSISLHLKVYESDMHLEVPDYALDMHTQRGRKKGRGMDHFHEEGNKLNNEDEVADPYKEEVKDLPSWNHYSPRPWMKDFAKRVREKGTDMVQGVLF